MSAIANEEVCFQIKKSSHHGDHKVPVRILDELAVRFLINLPELEKTDLVRVCFQMELAHWFYIDFLLPQYPELIEGTLHEFCAHMFNHVPFLRKYSHQVDSILDYWWSYKISVPVNGAILLNERKDKVLMVKGYGNKAGWTFPKGKINEEEEDVNCAVREVLEETGYDVSQLVKQDVYLEKVIRFKTIRLFLVEGVQENFHFQPRVRGEIQEIRWWDIELLPCSHSDRGSRKFGTAIPFIRELKLWARHGDTSLARYEDCHLSPPRGRLEEYIPESWSSFRLNLSEVECHEECDNFEQSFSFFDETELNSSSSFVDRSPGY